jgi:hypothetical protein
MCLIDDNFKEAQSNILSKIFNLFSWTRLAKALLDPMTAKLSAESAPYGKS